MNICYFVNQYPKVSHTFIRREILALEELGVEVTRIAARNDPNELVDTRDKEELEKTVCIAQGNMKGLLKSGGKVFLDSPMVFLKAFFLTLRHGVQDRNRIIYHLIYLFEACELLLICRDKTVDHVHAHFGTNSTSVAMLCRILGGPGYSFTVHGPEEFDRPGEISLGEKIIHSSFVVAITSFCRSQLYRWCDYKQWDKVVEVHCAVDNELLTKSKLPITSSNRFVCIGRLCEQKGQMLLLQALANIKRKGVSFHLDLIGDGELREEIETFIKINELSESVTMHGWCSTEEIIACLDAGSAMLLPSFAEGLPVVIMEAYARSRPVLSTYIAGIPELVAEDSGWLVTAGCVDSLEKKIEEICLLSTEELTVLGNKGHEKVSQRHSSTIEAQKIIDAVNQNGARDV